MYCTALSTKIQPVILGVGKGAHLSNVEARAILKRSETFHPPEKPHMLRLSTLRLQDVSESDQIY